MSRSQWLRGLRRGSAAARLLGLWVRIRRSQWPRGLRRGSAVASLLGLRVRIPPGAWIFVSCECCVLSGRGRSVRRADHLSRGVVPSVVCLKECDHETSIMRRPRPTRGCYAIKKARMRFDSFHGGEDSRCRARYNSVWYVGPTWITTFRKYICSHIHLVVGYALFAQSSRN
jgi:hypothetical protein